MDLIMLTIDNPWKWYHTYSSTIDIDWNAYMSFENNHLKELPERLEKTLIYLAKDSKLNKDDYGLYNPETFRLEPLSDEQWKEIFSLPNFTRILLHHFENDSWDSRLSVRETWVYTLNGNIYDKELLHKFVGLYRHDYITATLYEDIINKLKRSYNVNYRTLDRYRNRLPFIYAPTMGYASNPYNQYNIHIDIYGDALLEGTDINSVEDRYEPNTDLNYLELLNRMLFDGNKDTYKYFKNTKTENVLHLERMYNRTTYKMDKKVYMLEHDHDYSNLNACIIDFAAYKRNMKAIKEYLDDIDERFYKLSGKHILKKIK